MIECGLGTLRRAIVHSGTLVPTSQNQLCWGRDLMEYVAKVAGVIPENACVRLHILLEDGVDI